MTLKVQLVMLVVKKLICTICNMFLSVIYF